jgi:hypothetical protein
VTLRNKIFDLVLNLNTLNNVKGDLAKLQDQANERERQQRRQEEESKFMPSLASGSAFRGAIQTSSLRRVMDRSAALDDLMD